MKGAVFIALGDMVTEEHGMAVWHQLLDAVDDDGVFTATMNYPDERLLHLVEAICTSLNISAVEALRHFGEYLFHALHKSAPVFANTQPTFLKFIDSIGGVIHLEVYKLDDQARPPHISVSNITSNSADLTYRSDRKLCFLAEGLLKGAAVHYGVEIDIEHPKCMHNGADDCLLRIAQRG